MKHEIATPKGVPHPRLLGSRRHPATCEAVVPTAVEVRRARVGGRRRREARAALDYDRPAVREGPPCVSCVCVI